MMSVDHLSEQYVSDAFHSYLKSSLSQAKAERLVDTEMLSSAEGDLMITGPALCLYFAALRCTTTPPSVPLPRSSKTAPPTDLSPTNCPPAFVSFLSVWSANVPLIQDLAPEHQHDLARIICNLEPLTSPLNPSLNRIAAELRAVAIEISQRRTFQDRYAADLQAAIDAGMGASAQGREGAGRSRVKASFVPPPIYDPTPSSPTTAAPPPAPYAAPPISPYPSQTYVTPPTSPHRLAVPLSPTSGPSRHARTQSASSTRVHSRTSSASASRPSTPASASPSSSLHLRSRTPSPAPPTLLPMDAPAIALIRETLYAALADVLARTPSIRAALARDPPRAYFASVALAILDVSCTRTHLGAGGGDETSVAGVLGAHLTLSACPPPLRPFMQELAAIGAAARAMEEEDTELAVRVMQEVENARQRDVDLPEPRMERVRRILRGGVAAEDRHSGDESRAARHSGRRSIEGRAVTFANRVNALALGMTKLQAFRERQEEIFKVLAGVTS